MTNGESVREQAAANEGQRTEDGGSPRRIRPSADQKSEIRGRR
jgi:hypothetical protein